MDQHSLHWGDILNKLLNVSCHYRSCSVELLHDSKLCKGKKLRFLVTIQNCFCTNTDWENTGHGHLIFSLVEQNRPSTCAIQIFVVCTMQFHLHAWKFTSLFSWWRIAHNCSPPYPKGFNHPPPLRFPKSWNQVYSSSIGPWPPAATSSSASNHSASFRATSCGSMVQSTSLQGKSQLLG